MDKTRESTYLMISEFEALLGWSASQDFELLFLNFRPLFHLFSLYTIDNTIFKNNWKIILGTLAVSVVNVGTHDILANVDQELTSLTKVNVE